MLTHMLPAMAAAERSAARGDVAGAWRILRDLPLDDFGYLLLFMPDRDYPSLSRALPAMATPEVQLSWTGDHGPALLKLTCGFARAANYRYRELTGHSLHGRKILDYGCGYGRHLRLMHYFTDPENLAGCDPWDRSLELCREAGISCRLDQIDYLPSALPYEAGAFDFIYAFSVLTHTSLRATKAALAALRPVVSRHGVLAVTIRPAEYWDQEHPDVSARRREELKAIHLREGFAFEPHGRPPIDGDLVYGDTSMTLERLEELAEGWRIAGYDHQIIDIMQIVVYLRPN